MAPLLPVRRRPLHQVGLYDWMPWDQVMASLAWRQGEHIIAVGPTGQGKTTLIGQVLGLGHRKHLLVLGTKSHDDTYRELMRRHGLRRVEDWPVPRHLDRIMLWPRPKDTIGETIAHQRDVFRRTLDGSFRQGGWTIVLDEEHWMSQMLKLDREIATLHHQGRSSGITLVDGIQRPAWVPVVTYGSASHAFLWGTREETDLSRLSSLGGVAKRELAVNLAQLQRFEVVWVRTRSGEPPVRTRVAL